MEEALYLTKFARKVSIIHRRNELRAAKSIQEKAKANPKVHFIWDSVVKEIKGDGIVNSMVLENVKTKELTEIVADEMCIRDRNTTYHHLNNPVIHELYAEHGKTLNFIGVIITNENVYLADKERSSNWSSKLAEFFGVDGVIVSEEGFGNPDTDLIMNCKKIESKGIKTVLITDEYAGRDGTSQSLADADPLADAVVSGGNANEVIELPPMDKIIGHVEVADVIAGGFDGSLHKDGSITAELQVITGATNEMGFNKLSAR